MNRIHLTQLRTHIDETTNDYADYWDFNPTTRY
jgi:hypothetical protein